MNEDEQTLLADCDLGDAERRRSACSAFRGREKYQYRQFFRDLIKVMLDPSRNKNNAALAYHLVFASGSHVGSTANNVIHFVFLVRRLRIGAASGQDINPSTHR